MCIRDSQRHGLTAGAKFRRQLPGAINHLIGSMWTSGKLSLIHIFVDQGGSYDINKT